MSGSDLTIKERLFCRHYLANGYNGAQAAIAAGGAPSNSRVWAWQTLQKPEIKAHLDELIAPVEKKLDITFELKVKKLWNLVEAATPEEGEKLPAAFVISAIAELNKMQGHYKRRDDETDATEDKDKLNDLIDKHAKDY